MTGRSRRFTEFGGLGLHRGDLLVLVPLMLPSLFSIVSSGMLAVSLPVIQREFAVPVDLLGWGVAATVIPRVALEPIFGRLADVFGKRRLYLIGLVVFTVGSFLAIPAPSFAWLVLAAGIQGMGVASLSISMAMIAEIFPHERQGRAMGFWNSAGPVGVILGPLLGGWITEWFGWRNNFLLVSLACVGAVYIVIRYLPSRSKTQPGALFDAVGALALVGAVVSLLLAATGGSFIPFGSPGSLALWLSFGLALCVLLWDTLKRPTPLISVDFVRNRRFVGPTLAVTFRMFAHDGTRFVLILFLAQVLNYSPAASGWLMCLFSLPLLLGVTLGGWLADQWSARVSGLVGTLGQAAGILWMAWLGADANTWLLAPGMIASGLFAGACLIPFSKEAVSALGPQRVGLASGLYNMLRYSGAAAASPVLGLILAQGMARVDSSHNVMAFQQSFLLLAMMAGLAATAAVIIPNTPRAGPAPARIPVPEMTPPK